MRTYILPMVILALASLAFAGLGVIEGQDTKKEEAKPAEAKPKEEAKENDGEEKKVLTEKEFDELMKKVKTAWGKLKKNARNKMGPNASKYAKELEELAPQMLKYDGPVLTGENKGKKARDQKDFKEFVKSLQTHAKEYIKQVDEGKWEDSGSSKDGIGDSCSNCHKNYEPEEE